jgi:parallel beta-helix repeat protein
MRNLLACAFGFALALSPVLSACGGDDDDDDDVADDNSDDGDDNDDDGVGECGEIEGNCIVLEPSDDDQTALQTALIEAEPGDVIFLTAGTYELSGGLSLTVDQVTIRGEGEAESILSFAGQTEGAQGLLVTADDFTAEFFAVEDTAGDAIKVEGGSRIVFRGVRTEWTGEPAEEHGAYGVYPVQCSDVLVEDSIVRGASDAGIYVGQSERAVVRNNVVEDNVAGIEIENTFGADVYGNTATGNAGGVLVFNLPGLQVMNGAGTRVFDNDIIDNNGDNFAPKGNTVAQVPSGTGFVALAAHEVEVFDNRISGNQTAQLSVISYQITGNPIEDETYVPYADTLYFHDNTFEGGGDMPYTADFGLGLLLQIVSDMLELEAVPDIIIDGYFDPEKLDEKTGQLLPEFAVCLGVNDGADFLDLDFQGTYVEGAPVLGAPGVDAAPYDCQHDPLPAVELQGVAL